VWGWGRGGRSAPAPGGAGGRYAARPAAARPAAGAGGPAPLPRPREAGAERESGAAAPAGPRGSSAARTRNGLVKRAKRSAIQSAVDEAAAPRWQQEAAPTPDRSPDEVSGMLASLRSAHMRGGISVEKERERATEKERGADDRGGPGRGQDEQAQRAERAASKGDQK
ncbi:sensor protein, partial [Streptomyces sp. NPDC059152]